MTRVSCATGAKVHFQVEHQREINGLPFAPRHVHGLTFNPLNGTGRLQHVSEVADTLAATTATLNVDVDKVSFEQRFPKHIPRM